MLFRSVPQATSVTVEGLGASFFFGLLAAMATCLWNM